MSLDGSSGEVVIESRRGLLAYAVTTGTFAVGALLLIGPFTSTVNPDAPAWMRVVMVVIGAWVFYGGLGMLTEKVTVTSDAFIVKSLLRKGAVPWDEVGEIVAYPHLTFRLMVGVQERSGGRFKRGVVSTSLALHSNYREVIDAMLRIARSPKYEGRIKVSTLLQ